jgi:hypothetical protein
MGRSGRRWTIVRLGLQLGHSTKHKRKRGAEAPRWDVVASCGYYFSIAYSGVMLVMQTSLNAPTESAAAVPPGIWT